MTFGMKQFVDNPFICSGNVENTKYSADGCSGLIPTTKSKVSNELSICDIFIKQ
jgi:hypothetical protein